MNIHPFAFVNKFILGISFRFYTFFKASICLSSIFLFFAISSPVNAADPCSDSGNINNLSNGSFIECAAPLVGPWKFYATSAAGVSGAGSSAGEAVANMDSSYAVDHHCSMISSVGGAHGLPSVLLGVKISYVNSLNISATSGTDCEMPVAVEGYVGASRDISCPAGYSAFSDEDNPSKGGCFRQKSAICPKVGDPISVTSGAVVESFDDFIDASAHLRFTRFYNSQGFFSPRDNDPTKYISISSTWRHNWEEKIVQISRASGVYAYVILADGDYRIFQSAGSAWMGRTGSPEKLVTQYQSGVATGWLYTDEQDNKHAFNANGYLHQISFRGGQSVTLLYAGDVGLTPQENTALNGTVLLPTTTLVRIQDNFGRYISLRYSGSNQQNPNDTSDGAAFRLSKVIFPSGVTFNYTYDTSARLIGAGLSSYEYLDPSAGPTGIASELLSKIYDENGHLHASFDYLESYDSALAGRATGSRQWVNGNTAVNAVSLNISSTTSNGLGFLGRQIEVTDSLNNQTSYEFGLANGVLSVQNTSQPCSSGCNAASATSYDANGNISSKTDFNGNITNYVYDLTRNLETSRTEAYGTPQARTITTQWHSTYRLPTLITEPGKTTAFGYDTAGNLLTKTITDIALSKSRTWTYTYNGLGQVLTADGPRTDVLDKTTNTYYSSASSVAGNVYSIGDLATVTNALGHVTSITNYDLNGRPLTITDPNGVVTTLSYWPRGWLKSRTVNGSQTTTYDYDGVGQLTKVTLPDLSYLSYTYDTAHRLTDITDNAGNKTHYTLDAMSNRIQEDTKDPSGNILKTRSRIFDALNRLQKDVGGTSPSTQITQYGYDNNGNLKTVTDPLNHITTNGYDALNRLITVTDPANGVATTTYNALDQVTQVKDPRLVTTDYTINALGDVTLTASPDSGNTNKVYDLAGNVIQKTDARGVVSNYTYDALNRVTSITYPANTAENVTFTYDSTANGSKGIGRLTFYGNDGGSTVLMYDAFGNVITQTEMIGSQFYVTAYQYDNANRLSQITSPSGRIITYTRNTLGQITQVQTKENASAAVVTLISNATYEPFGPIKTLTYGNGVVTTVQHDADYRTSRITASSTPVWDYQYTYDAAGNLLQQTDQVGTINKTFGYDALDRVTTDTNNTGNWAYQYDAAGNRTQRVWVNTSNATSTQTLTYATSSNRITKNSTATQTLDAAGNITGNGQTLAYNNANHLSLVSSGSTVKAGFRYNALNQRTSKLQITKPMDFHYGLGGQIIGLTAYNPTVLYQRNDYIWLDDIPVAQTRIIYNSNGSVNSRRTTYVHADHLNTPRAMTDSTGKLVWRWDGDAYASQKPNENPDGDGTTDTLNLRFPGQFFDAETGFIYNWNRYYDPATGRYTQSDPIGLDGGLNTYGYANANPNSYIDPDGNFAFLLAIPLIEGGLTITGFDLGMGAIIAGMASMTGDTPAASDISKSESDPGCGKWMCEGPGQYDKVGTRKEVTQMGWFTAYGNTEADATYNWKKAVQAAAPRGYNARHIRPKRCKKIR